MRAFKECVYNRDFDIKTTFKSGKTLRSHLTKVNDTIPIRTSGCL